MDKSYFIQRIINSQPTADLYSKHYKINSHHMGESAVGFESYDETQMKEFENELKIAVRNHFNKDADVTLLKRRGYEDDWTETPPPYRLYYCIYWKMTNNEIINEKISELYEKYNKQRIESASLTSRKRVLEASMDDLYKKINDLRSQIV